MTYKVTIIIALATLLSGCKTLSDISELRPSLRRPNVTISNPSQPTQIGASLNGSGDIQLATRKEMKSRFPGPVSVQIVPSIQNNDVDCK